MNEWVHEYSSEMLRNMRDQLFNRVDRGAVLRESQAEFMRLVCDVINSELARRAIEERETA